MATATTVLSPVGESRSTRVLVAVLRVGLALLWIQNVGWKIPPDFGQHNRSGLYHYVLFAKTKPVFGPYTWMVSHVVLPHFEVFGWITVSLESALGAFLLVGFATRLWALIGVAQSLNISLSVLYAPGEWHWSYYLMILAHLTLFATAAGRSFGLDGLFRPMWLDSTGRAARLLARLS